MGESDSAQTPSVDGFPARAKDLIFRKKTRKISNPLKINEFFMYWDVIAVTSFCLGFPYKYSRHSGADGPATTKIKGTVKFPTKRQTIGNDGAQNNRPKAIATAAELPKGETTMLLEFKYLLLTTWTSWCGLFKSIPYGDPYLAIFVLVVLVCASAKWLADGESA